LDKRIQSTNKAGQLTLLKGNQGIHVLACINKHRDS